MHRIFKTLALSVFTSFVVFAPVSAAKPAPANVGNDVSWPQCGKTLPTTHAFGIVGVNGGLATTLNKCLAEQLVWAKQAPGTPTQKNIQLYVNTANPGEIIDQVTTWPTSNTDPSGNIVYNKYGTCAGANDLACSWQYGWNRAVEDMDRHFPGPAAAAGVDTNPASYTWWLDVETMNTWQSGSAEALARNAATLEGMTSAFQNRGAKVGLYSTGYQWKTIVGTLSEGSNLHGLPSWLAGSRNLSNAKANCTMLAGLTNGSQVVLTQYVSANLDYDYSCI